MTRILLVAALLGLASAQAAQPGTAIPARALPDLCKNHYILDQPCSIAAVDTAIGLTGAVVVDPHGTIFFSGPNIVYKIDPSGSLTRVAGNGQPGFSGDGGPAVDALLDIPWWDYPELQRDFLDFSELLGPLALDAAGNLYIGDVYNNRVRRVTPEGIIDTVVGSGAQVPLPRGGLPALQATLWWPQGLAVDSKGGLLIADGTGILQKVDDDGRIVFLTQNNCGALWQQPGLCAPEGIAVNAADEVFVADIYCRVRRVRSPDDVQTVAGDERPDRHGSANTCGTSPDGGAANRSALAWPFAVAADTAGNLFIADTYNHCIRKVDLDGIMTTVAGRCGESGVAPPSGSAFVAGLHEPHGIAVDPMGNLYVADTRNYRIRKVTPDGIMTTIAGNGGAP